MHEAREGEGTKSRQRKQRHVGVALEDYVESKKNQTNKTLDALKEKRKDEEHLYMRKCMNEMEAMDGFTDEKSYVVEVFESDINIETFLSTMNHIVRRMWLNRKIRYVHSIHYLFFVESVITLVWYNVFI
jgi:sulfite reductase alpha subunit-like flavoprotein